MGAVPLGAVGTVRVKPPSTAVALPNGLESRKRVSGTGGETYGANTGPVTVMKAP